MIYRARTIYPVTRPPIENGAVVVKGAIIRDLGSWEEITAKYPQDEVTDLGERVLLPGLINAHCHLDYTMMRRAILPQTSFAEWIRRINALKRSFTAADYLESIRNGFAELIRWGTTSVFNIESFPELIPELGPPPIRTWWFYELIDIRSRLASDELVAGALSFFDGRSDWLGGFGLSPHAPFTASPELFRLAQACHSKTGMPLTTHLAESAEEWQMFASASGHLHDFLKSLGRDMKDCGETTPMRWFLQAGLDPRRWLLVHANEVADSDLHLMGNHLSGMYIVHCPLSHSYFRHRPFRASELASHGVTLCLGTDSLASTSSLCLFSEMRQFANQHPEFSPAAVLKMVTVHPAEAIGEEQRIGQISPGAYADLIAVPSRGADPAESILQNREPVEFILVHGDSPKQNANLRN